VNRIKTCFSSSLVLFFNSSYCIPYFLADMYPKPGPATESTAPYEKQKPDPTVAKANKRLASRFYQLKTGHCLTGQYLAWTTRRPDATCWWCQYSIQTREHLFKNCPQ